jgi:hypothetical protein
MPRLEVIGFVLFGIGLVPFTIGGLIHMAYHPKSWDARVPSQAWRWTPTLLWDRKAWENYDWSMFTHSMSRWWCWIGSLICAAGMISIIAGSGTVLSLLGSFLALMVIEAAVSLVIVMKKRRSR